MARGTIAAAEARSADALEDFRGYYDRVGCDLCGLFELARAYDRAGHTDSAMTPYGSVAQDRAFHIELREASMLGPAHKRLGELYEQKGDRDKALESYTRFVDLWKDADPELQPLVQDVKQRIARLVGERR